MCVNGFKVQRMKGPDLTKRFLRSSSILNAKPQVATSTSSQNAPLVEDIDRYRGLRAGEVLEHGLGFARACLWSSRAHASHAAL